MWIILVGFLLFGIAVTAGALVAGLGANDSMLGWVVLGIETVLLAGALAVLDSRWFWKPPSHIPTAVLTGMFLRLTIAESVLDGLLAALHRLGRRTYVCHRSRGVDRPWLDLCRPDRSANPGPARAG